MAIDFDELFSGETVIKVRFRGVVTFHHLRQPTPSEDLEYRRRSARMNLKSHRFEPQDQALEAPVWLYDKLCQRVMAQNGTGEQEPVPLEKLQNAPRLKLEVINGFLGDMEREEAEEIKN